MADTNETIADIIAWLRRPREGENAYLTLWRDEIANRLEAAHKRERGDCAKLREALVKCREIALQWQADEAAGVAGTTDKPHARSAAEAVVDMEFEISAALAAPPRNCDVYTADELKAIFKSELISQLPIANEHEKNLITITATGVIDTLLAPVTEKEGCNDGK